MNFKQILDIILTHTKKERKKPMNKSELINVVSQETELSKKDAEVAVNAVLNAITEALKSGDKVAIAGFGTFEVKDIAAREGRNPQTNETITIAAYKKPAFSASKALKDALNG